MYPRSNSFLTMIPAPVSVSCNIVLRFKSSRFCGRIICIRVSDEISGTLVGAGYTIRKRIPSGMP